MAVMMLMLVWALALCNLVDAKVLEKHAVPIFSVQHGDGMFLRNVVICLRNFTAPKLKTTLYPIILLTNMNECRYSRHMADARTHTHTH
jgi:hypothetical protein